MSTGAPGNRRRPGKAVREFYVVWTAPPSDEVIIAAGARALRLHAERKARAESPKPR